MKPIGSKKRKEGEGNSFDSSRQPLSASKRSNIKIIVYKSNESERKKSEEGEIGFFSVPERIANRYSKNISKLRA
jgi:hypothetical protein